MAIKENQFFQNKDKKLNEMQKIFGVTVKGNVDKHAKKPKTEKKPKEQQVNPNA